MDNKSYLILQCIKDSVEPIPAKDIQEYLLSKGFKMDIKTVYEYIKRINEFYYPFLQTTYIGSMRRKGYYIENDLFTDGQFQLIVDSIRFNHSLSSEECNDLINKFKKISHCNQLDHMDVALMDNYSEGMLLNLNNLFKAIKDVSNVIFQYVDYDVVDQSIVEVASKNGNRTIGLESYYCVSPYYITMSGQYYYLYGYCDKRPDQLSVYRVDRIRLLRKHSSDFIETREQYDLGLEMKQSVNMFVSDQKIDLHIKFDRTIIREVVNRFGKQFKIIKRGNNYECIIPDVSNSDGLIGWILMMQEHIEVIKPLEVRNVLKEKILYLTKKY